MSAPSGVRSLLRDAARLDVGQADIPGSIRCTLGVMLPLAIGLATGGVADGVYAAIGALCAGFASFQGAYRGRVAITVVVGIGMAAATVTGAIGARADWSAVAVVAAWAFVVGLLPALGQAALVVGLQWGVAVVIVNAVPTPPALALLHGGMILAGALVQTGLTVLAWPIRTYRPERSAVSAAYRDLAGLAESLVRSGGLGVPTTVTDDARRALGDPHPLGRAGQLLAFQALVDEADRIRIALVALTSVLPRLRPPLGSPSPSTDGAGGAGGAVTALFEDAAACLRSVADAVLADAPPAGSDVMSGPVEQKVATLTALAEANDPGTSPEPWAVRDAAFLAGRLAGQLRSVLRIGEESAGNPRAAQFEGVARPRRHRRPLAEAALTLRANISWRSAIFRHAVRLSATLAAAMVISRASGLPHGYWIALTALLVLRQDYTATALRGVSRIVGTVLGAVIATILVALVHPGPAGLTVMFGVATFVAFVIVRVNYGLFSICVTAYVVFLLAFASEPVVATAGDRLVSTLIGGALAIGVYLTWPTWESQLVGPVLGEFLDAQATYADGVLSCHADPASATRNRLPGLRHATRLARSNAEQSVLRMGVEPERSRREALLSLDDARGVLASGRRVSLAVLSLHAHLPDEKAPALPELEPLRAGLTAAMQASASRARAKVAPSAGGGTELRALHDELTKEMRRLGLLGEERVAIVTAETDELVDAVNSASELLGSGAVA